MNDIVSWLLEDEQPSIRYHTLTQLLDKPEGDPEVEAAHAMIAKKGWAVDILRKQSDTGWWVTDESLYRPKYSASNWMLLVLADLGLDTGVSSFFLPLFDFSGFRSRARGLGRLGHFDPIPLELRRFDGVFRFSEFSLPASQPVKIP